MRFQRMQRYERFEWTPRKLQSFLQRGERQPRKVDQTYPLLGAALLVQPAPAPGTDAELAARRAANTVCEKRMRDLNAGHWWRARAQYFGCEPDARHVIRRAWNAWTGPANAQMFPYVVEQHSGAAEARRQRVRAVDVVLRQQLHATVTTQTELEL